MTEENIMDLFNQYLVISIENKGEYFVITWNMITDIKHGNIKDIVKDDALQLYHYLWTPDTLSGGYGKIISDIINAFHSHNHDEYYPGTLYHKHKYGICLCVIDCILNDTI